MLHKNSILIGLSIISNLLAFNANAGLYGFTQANPYTKQELNSQSVDFPEYILNYRDLMRENVIMLSDFAKQKNPRFEILVHEGSPLLQDDIWEYHLNDYNHSRKYGYSIDNDSLLSNDENIHSKNFKNLKEDYIKKIDGVVLNNYLCEQRSDKIPANKQLISIETCTLSKNSAPQIISYQIQDEASAFKKLKHNTNDKINADNIEKLSNAKNIAFLLDTSKFKTKYDFLKEIDNSNFDIIVISPFFQQKPLTKEDINHLKYKKNGALRKVYAGINISEADSTKFYWQKGWKIGSPEWLKRASFVDSQGIITQYWHPQWQKLLSKHFKGIVDLGFDGAFLSGVENYEYYEKLTPLE